MPSACAKLERGSKRCKDANARIRYHIVLLTVDGWSGNRIARALECATSTISRTLDRWRRYGEAGLIDGREDNGNAKADDGYPLHLKAIFPNSYHTSGWKCSQKRLI
jgi:hypothetical protein